MCIRISLTMPSPTHRRQRRRSSSSSSTQKQRYSQEQYETKSKTSPQHRSKDVVDTLATIFGSYSTSGSRAGSPHRRRAEEEDNNASEWPSHKQALEKISQKTSSKQYPSSSRGGTSQHQELSESEDNGDYQPKQSRYQTGRSKWGGSGTPGRSATATHYSQAEDASRVEELWKQTHSENKEKDRMIANMRNRLKHGEEELERYAKNERAHFCFCFCLDSTLSQVPTYICHAELTTARRHEREGVELRDVTRSNTELKDRIRFLELQLDEYKTDNTRLRSSYQEALTKLSESLRVLEEKATDNDRLKEENEELQQQVQSLEEEKESILNRSLENLRAYEEDTLERQRQLNLHKDAVTAAEEQSKMLRSQLDQASERIAAIESSNIRYQEEADAARKNKEAAQEEAERAKQAAQMADSLRTQVKHMKLDNARLVRLLASTREYKEFVNYTFTPDNGAATGRIRASYLATDPSPDENGYDEYLGGPAKSPSANEQGNYDMASWREIESFEQHYGVDDSQPINEEREQDLWVPSEALRLTIQFRRKHLPHVPTQIIRNFLKSLNSVWRRRYTRQISRTSEQYEREISKLKRKLDQKAPYREVLQASTISRMQQQMEALRKAGGGQIGFPFYDKSKENRNYMKNGKKKRQVNTRKPKSVSSSRKDGQSNPVWQNATSFNLPTSGAGSDRKQEGSRIMENALGAVENLSRQVSELKEENQQLSESLDRQGDTMIPRESLMEECKQAYMAAVLWLGGRWMKHTNVLVEHSTAICSAMRSLVLDQKTNFGEQTSELQLPYWTESEREEKNTLDKTRKTSSDNLFDRQIE